jgi:hypothetical protein
MCLRDHPMERTSVTQDAFYRVSSRFKSSYAANASRMQANSSVTSVTILYSIEKVRSVQGQGSSRETKLQQRD